MLNDRWNLWQDILRIEGLNDVLLFNYQDPRASDTFRAVNADHNNLAEMFFAYMEADSEAAELLLSPRLCLYHVQEALDEMVDVEIILGGSEDGQQQGSSDNEGDVQIETR